MEKQCLLPGSIPASRGGLRPRHLNSPGSSLLRPCSCPPARSHGLTFHMVLLSTFRLKLVSPPPPPLDFHQRSLVAQYEMFFSFFGCSIHCSRSERSALRSADSDQEVILPPPSPLLNPCPYLTPSNSHILS